MSPHEVKFQLGAKLLARAEAGRVPTIASLHSIVVEGDQISAGFDLVPDGEVMFFEFERPAAVSPGDIPSFVAWLAWSGYGETMH
jgi:hypothetical protein